MSLNAMPLSARASGGRPSTRSAMMFRNTSSVPPAIRRPGQAHDELSEIGNPMELLDDVLQRRPADLRVETGKDQGHRAARAVTQELGLESLEIGLAQTMQCGDCTRLVKIGH